MSMRTAGQGRTRAGRSLSGFGAYGVVMGIALCLAPDRTLDLLLTARTTEHWVRLLGATATLLGWYYIVAGRAEAAVLIHASLWGRLGLAAAFTGLVVAGLAPVLLLGIAGNEMLGVLWTTLALRADARDGAPR
ncbi:MAG: hypothetical protein P3A33_06840 [Gemmatimonadota bacterium]|jgi:hypothetical protein|nr:hypothetical protein [Gemmatimonadota bacterium]